MVDVEKLKAEVIAKIEEQATANTTNIVTRAYINHIVDHITSRYLLVEKSAAPVGLEALKCNCPMYHVRKYGARGGDKPLNYRNGWNDCIDHLAAQGYLNAPMPEIEGLDDALDESDDAESANEHPLQALSYDDQMIILQAARAYQSMVRKD